MRIILLVSPFGYVPLHFFDFVSTPCQEYFYPSAEISRTFVEKNSVEN